MAEKFINMIYQESPRFNRFDTSSIMFYFSNILLEFARKKKLSGLKKEKQKGKLPNQIRHDENAAIAVGTWKKRNKRKKK